IRYNQMRSLLELSNLPKNRQRKTQIFPIEIDEKVFDKLEEAKNDIVNIVNNGGNIYICGDKTGNGKTTWAIRLMLKYFDMVWANSYDTTRGLYVHVPTFFLDVKNFENRPEYIDRIEEADMVIWDDLAATDMLTNFEHEHLLRYIDSRINNNKCNIYTSNITDRYKLIDLIGNRLASRVYNCSTIYELHGGDVREYADQLLNN
ncbi:MAG: hypothetical protein VZS44_12495, partial [Bacilli bacterium]|nr:hypothetical protein [Bacilli bacterium]